MSIFAYRKLNTAGIEASNKARDAFEELWIALGKIQPTNPMVPQCNWGKGDMFSYKEWWQMTKCFRKKKGHKL